MEKVFAGSSGDHRWRLPINPDKPQTIRSTPKKKDDVLKVVRDENAAVKDKLEKEIEKHLEAEAKNKELETTVETLTAEIASLKNQITNIQKEAQDVVSAAEEPKKPAPRSAKGGVPRKPARTV